MKYFFYIVFILSFISPYKQNFLTLPRNSAGIFIQTSSSKDVFCEMVRELYIESEWYLSKLTNIETVDGMEISKLLQYLFKAIYDTTAEQSREYMNQYQQFSVKTIFSVQRGWGILNPLTISDWEQIMMMFIPFVAKNNNSQGQTCLRPSQLSMILYTLFQANLIKEEDRQNCLNIFLDSLKNDFDYEQALDQKIDEIFDKRNELQIFYEDFATQNEQIIINIKQKIKQYMDQRITDVKQFYNVHSFLDKQISDYDIKLNQIIARVSQIKFNTFEKILFIATNKQVSYFLDLHAQTGLNILIDGQPIYSQWKENSMKIEDPNYDIEEENWFQETLNYILIQKFKQENPTKKYTDDMEIINEQKGKIDTRILNSMDIHIRLKYKIVERQMTQLKKDISILKMFKQNLLKNNSSITWDELLNERSIRKNNIVKYLLENIFNTENLYYFLQKNFDSQLDLIITEQPAQFKLGLTFQQWLYDYLSEEVYKKEFYTIQQSIDDQKESFKRIMNQNFNTMQSDYYQDYIYFFLIYNYNVVAENLSLSFIIDFSQRIKEKKQLEQDLNQFSHFYFDLMKISIDIEDTNLMLSSDQYYITERIRKKLGYTFSAIGMAGLLGFEVFFSWASGLVFLHYNALIPKSQITQAIKNSSFMTSAKENFSQVKSYITGQRASQQQNEILQKYEKMDFMSKTNIELLTKTDLNLRIRLLKLNEQNFYSQDSLFLWKNLKPIVNILKI